MNIDKLTRLEENLKPWNSSEIVIHSMILFPTKLMSGDSDTDFSNQYKLLLIFPAA
ncbi:MAG: hypothetical protein M5T52_00930 [Ignavibacteriaceae bacterium]|nr:hypothetical protein [Ignavibacteriaceae bacterium]